MSNHPDITIDDFENICRTCLSPENLKPLYEECLVDMLLACTFVKFTEDDGLPVKICSNCINEISQAYSFAKRCETTDTILRNCVKNIKTELVNNSPQSQEAEPIIEDMKIDIKPEIILPNINQTVPEVVEDYEYVEVKQEVDVKVEYEEVNQDETCDDPEAETYEENMDEDQNETCSEKSDNPVSRPKRRIHTGEKTYACGISGRSFVGNWNFTAHKQTNIGNRPHVCSVCSKSFSRSGTLKNHMRVHTGEKPYFCEVCGKSFTSDGVLTRHKKIHTGEKNYFCSLCKKGFIQFSTLESHLRIHAPP